MLVFGTEMHLVTFVYICIIFLNFFPVIFNIIQKKNKLYHLRFCFLLLAIFFNNLSSGLLPDKNFSINVLSQNIIAYTVGLITTIYYYHYIHTDYNIRVIRYLNLNFILIILEFNLILFFIIPYTITENLRLSRNFFLITPLFIITIVFFNTTFYEIKKFMITNGANQKFHIIAGIMGLFSICSLPVVMFFLGDKQAIEQSFFTIGLFFLTVSYYISPEKTLEKQNGTLTAREKEIFDIVLKNPELKYSEYSVLLFISEKTFSTHMSNIYKKLNVKNKKELYKKYSSRKLNKK